MEQLTLSNIMVVDDDHDILSQIVKIFSKLKIENVKTFTQGEMALAELSNAKNPYDCIFIDVKMPGMSGVGLLQGIKSSKDKKIKDIFCIPIIGNITKEESTILQELNCTETIIKPIIETAFLKRFRELSQLHNDPDSDKNFLVSFNNALLDKKYSQAELLILPKLKKDSNNIKYLVLYAELLMKAKQWQKAEEFLHKVLKIDNNYIPALNLISKVYIKLGKFNDAMLFLEKAKNLSPLHVDRLLVIGEMNLGSGDSQKAEESFRNALKINPSEEKASYGLGRALAVQGKIEESKKILSSIQKGQELASFFNNKGILLVKAKKIGEGISLYQNALKVMDDKERDYLLLYNIALAYSKQDNIDSAIEYSLKAIEKSPKDYLKPSKLLDNLKKLKSERPSIQEIILEKVEDSNDKQAPQNDKQPEFILTDNQIDFITGGFDDEEKIIEEPKEDEFITYGL